MRSAFLLLVVLALGSVLVSAIACGYDERRVKPGTSEVDVVRVLGTPSRTITDREVFNAYLPFPGEQLECVPKVAKILYYRSRFGKSVTVGLDSTNKVACIRGSFDSVQCGSLDCM